MCPHLHLPLQSGSDSVLKRMARRTTLKAFRHLVETARSVNPDFAVTTDVIAGFPGETDEEFRETMAFVKEMPFAGGHVFPYSPRPGTAAARMKEQIAKAVQKERAKQLRDLFDIKSESFARSFIGSEQKVLWESSQSIPEVGWETRGLTGNYLTVRAVFPGPVRNRIDRVCLTDWRDGELTGEIISGSEAL
jgi:threonylcarbamoyladenosine tRNA methylthiotransferase MtaB